MPALFIETVAFIFVVVVVVVVVVCVGVVIFNIYVPSFSYDHAQQILLGS
jgi:hypothetical protein